MTQQTYHSIINNVIGAIIGVALYIIVQIVIKYLKIKYGKPGHKQTKWQQFFNQLNTKQ